MNNFSKPYLEEINKDKLDYFLSLFSRKSETYDMCVNKVNTLATISAIFIGAVVILLDKNELINQTSNVHIKSIPINMLMILVLVLPFLISLAITIWHVSPDKIINPKSSIIKRDMTLPNHRAMLGIRQYKNFEEYEKYISTLTIDQICNQIINQIYVLNGIVWNMQIIIKVALFMNLIGIGGFVVILLLTILT